MNGKAFYHFLLTICILCGSYHGFAQWQTQGKALTIFEAKMKI